MPALKTILSSLNRGAVIDPAGHWVADHLPAVADPQSTRNVWNSALNDRRRYPATAALHPVQPGAAEPPRRCGEPAKPMRR